MLVFEEKDNILSDSANEDAADSDSVHTADRSDQENSSETSPK